MNSSLPTQNVVYDPDAREVLRFQLHRSTIALFKSYLIILEDLGLDHDTAMSKLYDALPEQYRPYVDLADYLTEEKGKQLRSKILGTGNDTLRAIDDILKTFVVEFKK